jgi:hypothetical protein
LHETERKQRADEYARARTLYYRGTLAKTQLIQAEKKFLEAIHRVDEDKQWLADYDLAVNNLITSDKSSQR